MKQHGRGFGSYGVLRLIMLNVWQGTQRCTPHAAPTLDMPPNHTQWQAHLAALLHSPHPHDHTRLHCLLYAELAAEHALPLQLAWLTQQPCWACCNPWRQPPGRMLIAQAAMVAVIQAAVRLVHCETSQAASEALQTLELVHGSLYSRPLEADADEYLVEAINAVAEQHPHGGPGSRRYVDVCRLVCEGAAWSPEQHRRYPRRFQEAVRTLLLCMHASVDVALGVDELQCILSRAATPLSCWM